MIRQGVFWSTIALLGIVCAAAVAWSASRLAGQHIGLAAAPFSVARGLAPRDPEGTERSNVSHAALRRHPGRGNGAPATSPQRGATTPVVSAPSLTPPARAVVTSPTAGTA